MYEAFESLPKSTQRAFAPAWDGKPKREIEQFWSLGGGDGVPEVRLYLSTRHNPDGKSFTSTLSWDTLEPAEPGSPFSVMSWSSDHRMVTVFRSAVARYSKKALVEEHARALRWFESNYESMAYYLVAQQAAEKSGLDNTEVPA